MNRGANVKEQTKTIWKLNLQGENSREIAKRLGLTKTLVDSAISRGKESGDIPKRKTNPLLFNNSNYIKMGSIGGIINTLNHEQLIWLTDEAHGLGCETIAEMILEIVRDAYEETRGGI
tara:strand:+ start:2540 stop:2896 length:357 start_codon:yes stop_codon:yes gene_type:complete